MFPGTERHRPLPEISFHLHIKIPPELSLFLCYGGTKKLLSFLCRFMEKPVLKYLRNWGETAHFSTIKQPTSYTKLFWVSMFFAGIFHKILYNNNDTRGRFHCVICFFRNSKSSSSRPKTIHWTVFWRTLLAARSASSKIHSLNLFSTIFIDRPLCLREKPFTEPFLAELLLSGRQAPQISIHWTVFSGAWSSPPRNRGLWTILNPEIIHRSPFHGVFDEKPFTGAIFTELVSILREKPFTEPFFDELGQWLVEIEGYEWFWT